MSSQKKIRHMVVSLKSKPKQGFIQYTLEDVRVKSVKPINPSKNRRAAYERISLSYEQIRWVRRMPEKSSAVVAAN